jgi:hypothetical protein
MATDERAYQSKPPTYAGLNAGARGMADHATRDADSLLTWYRTGGREQAQAVQMYVARRVLAARWDCTLQQAVAVIDGAMHHVATRQPRAGCIGACLRKETFLEYRAQASAWLRAGIMEAEWRYDVASLEAEPLPT